MPRILNPFYVTIDPNQTTSSDFITGSIPGISFYYPTSSFTNPLTTGSLGSIGVNVEEYNSSSGVISEMIFVVPNSNGTANTGSVVLSLSHTGSNNEPRVGIGFDSTLGEKPIRPFDIKTKSDTNEGTEILLRSGRISAGAQPGDTVGTINFIAESSSFNKYGQIALSGSVANITTVVRTIDEEGASGDIIFSTTSTGSKYNPAGEVMRLTGDGKVQITGSTFIQNSLTVEQSATSNTSFNSPQFKGSGHSYFVGGVTVGGTINYGNILKVEGNAEIDGNTKLGTPGSTTTVTGSFKTNGTVYIPNIGDSSATDNVVVIDSGYLKSASVDAKIFANPNTLVSRNTLGAAINQIPIYTGDTTILTGSNSLLFNPATSTLTAPGFISTPTNLLSLVAITSAGSITTLGSLYASLSYASESYDNVVVYDPTTDKFYYTGSYQGPQGVLGSQGLQGSIGIQGAKGNPGLGLQGVQGASGIGGANISASGYISASSGWIENSLTIGGINNVSQSIYEAAQSGGSGETPTLQEVTDAGASTITAITASIIRAKQITATTALTSTGRLTATNITASIVSASDTIHTKFLNIPQSTGGTSEDGAIYFGSSISGNNGVIYDDGNKLQIGYNDSDVISISDTIAQIATNLKLQTTLQFQTQSIIPTAVAGALYVDSDNNLYIAQ